MWPPGCGVPAVRRLSFLCSKWVNLSLLIAWVEGACFPPVRSSAMRLNWRAAKIVGVYHGALETHECNKRSAFLGVSNEVSTCVTDLTYTCVRGAFYLKIEVGIL